MKKYVLIIIFAIFAVITAGTFNKEPEISVIMSTYNREKKVPKAIESILNQTFKNFEFIIINDGSTDGTADVLRHYAQKDKRIKIISHARNYGLVTGLNEGLDIARGKYIARMDDDDWSVPNRFERQLKFMKKHPEFTVVGTLIRVNNGSISYQQKNADTEKNKILLYCGRTPLSHPSIMIRKEFLDKHNIRYDDKYKSAEDMAFFRDIIDNGGRLTVMQEVLLYYYYHWNDNPSYHAEQAKNVDLFSGEMLRRLTSDTDMKRYGLCSCMNIIAAHEDKNVYVGKKTLESMMEEYRCRK